MDQATIEKEFGITKAERERRLGNIFARAQNRRGSFEDFSAGAVEDRKDLIEEVTRLQIEKRSLEERLRPFGLILQKAPPLPGEVVTAIEVMSALAIPNLSDSAFSKKLDERGVNRFREAHFCANRPG